MTIDDLVRLVPPPANPIHAFGDWGQIEAALGLELPMDFKSLVEFYGVGKFVDFITPLTPFGPRNFLVQSAQKLLDSERPFREENPEQCPYPYYPEPGGLLEWAATDNGDRLCWVTDGEPDTWTVVAWNPRACDYHAHDTGAAAFLHGWLSGLVDTTVFPAYNNTAAPWFEPNRELRHVYIKLTDGHRSYPERLQILRKALSPTANRGGWAQGDQRQDHFAATELGWNLTYETAYGHQIRIAFPPDDEQQVRVALLDAIHRMGCEVLSTKTHLGQPVWG
ncbi:SMI1/KNR4 family protein [Nocardia sp. SYP-A9097]|uniref:SMI1/KNR4 family protein n=1 Tax=Nocardia sp. SYP-A9097 TaxID=2663237 RepID=UPI00129B1D61|nr:SMI1/KNR4 family protein [Nocardia sp. SYP-A9097]MRH93565.1 SMI1/KNR4 family protein [Nocardia sp. SYP-A9097]